MKKIYIYTPYWSTMGGGEKYVILLAEELAKLPDVNISLISTSENISRSKLAEFSNADLKEVEFVYVAGISELRRTVDNADLFVCLSNFKLIRTNALRHVQLLQIPYAKINAHGMVQKLSEGRIKESVKDLYRCRLLSFSTSGADAVITNSRFVGETLLKYHNIKSEVLNPPIQDFSREGISKKNIILSVGRFFNGLYNDKRYDILTHSFRRLSSVLKDQWEYHIVGSAGDDSETDKLVKNLKEENKGFPVCFHINEKYDSLVRIYNEATIFWHAAGFGVDESKQPERVEHFGMTTVEAMSAGCIPVVADRGGQREIITNDLNGCLWDTTDQLIEQTMNIINDPEKLIKFRIEAKKRYSDFNMERFHKRVVEIFSPLLK